MAPQVFSDEESTFVATALWLTVGTRAAASSRVRAYRMSDALVERGVDSRCLPGRGVKGRLRALAHLMTHRRPDVIVIQKLLYGRVMLRILRLLARRLVWECDDAIQLGYPGSSPTSQAEIGRRLPWTLALVDLVTTSNDLLAADLKPASGLVTMYRGPAPPAVASDAPRERVLLWLGSPSTEPYLSLMGDVAKTLKARGWRCVAVGGSSEAERLGWTPVPWSLITQEKWLTAAAVGVMPQPAGAWADRKQGYKLLEYAAREIVPVSSNVYPAQALLAGSGLRSLLVSSSEAWLAGILRAYDERPMLINELQRLTESASVTAAVDSWLAAVSR